METNCTQLSYEETGFFSKIAIDYVNQTESLQPFYQHPLSLDGIIASIAARQNFATNRSLLVAALKKQYEGLPLSQQQQANLQSLLLENTFTITTAHQPNIFTGPLYFIYKIVHAIKMADELKQQLPTYNFVPFYYMGSEDADLEELGFINLKGEKLTWETKQTGAVGRMKVDKALLKMIDAIYGQIGVLPSGDELTKLFRQAYTEGKTIQQATLEMVNALFANFGLLILIPDNKELKQSFEPIVKKELEDQFSHTAVKQTIEALEKLYKVQAGGRELNLFYLIDNKRERIEFDGVNYAIASLKIEFSKVEILAELEQFPERFSANVILRGVFQETILPNIAFIGGGGELAYWLELKNVFLAAEVPYPVLVLRNSFLLKNELSNTLINKLNLNTAALFKPSAYLINELVKRHSQNQLSLTQEIDELKAFYQKLATIAANVDNTLVQHTAALETQALQKVQVLEKKLLKAEKRKFADQRNQINQLKANLFPNNNLQERVENFATYYATEGNTWIEKIYHNSIGLGGGFMVVG